MQSLWALNIKACFEKGLCWAANEAFGTQPGTILYSIPVLQWIQNSFLYVNATHAYARACIHHEIAKFEEVLIRWDELAPTYSSKWISKRHRHLKESYCAGAWDARLTDRRLDWWQPGHISHRRSNKDLQKSSGSAPNISAQFPISSSAHLSISLFIHPVSARTGPED